MSFSGGLLGRRSAGFSRFRISSRSQHHRSPFLEGQLFGFADEQARDVVDDVVRPATFRRNADQLVSILNQRAVGCRTNSDVGNSAEVKWHVQSLRRVATSPATLSLGLRRHRNTRRRSDDCRCSCEGFPQSQQRLASRRHPHAPG